MARRNQRGVVHPNQLAVLEVQAVDGSTSRHDQAVQSAGDREWVVESPPPNLLPRLQLQALDLCRPRLCDVDATGADDGLRVASHCPGAIEASGGIPFVLTIPLHLAFQIDLQRTPCSRREAPPVKRPSP